MVQPSKTAPRDTIVLGGEKYQSTQQGVNPSNGVTGVFEASICWSCHHPLKARDSHEPALHANAARVAQLPRISNAFNLVVANGEMEKLSQRVCVSLQYGIANHQRDQAMKLASRLNLIIRRIHLYSGLFLFRGC